MVNASTLLDEIEAMHDKWVRQSWAEAIAADPNKVADAEAMMVISRRVAADRAAGINQIPEPIPINAKGSTGEDWFDEEG